MDIRQLRCFVTVAETGHVTRAAALLGMQQPPLSQQIRRLEDQLGLPLFVRHPRGVHLTEAGEALLPDARRLVDELDALQERMRAQAQGVRGRLAIGFTSSAASHAFTPALLRACWQRYPALTLQISELNAAEITESVAQGRLHAGLLRVPVARPEGLRFETLLREPALLALPQDHPLAGQDPLPLATLHGQPLILVRRPGAPGLYANLLTLCAERGLKPRVVAEVERMTTNLNLVAAGMGLSVVPASMRRVQIQAVAFAALADADLDAPLTLVSPAEDAGPATRRFVTLARSLARRLPPEPAAAASAPARRRDRRP